MSAEWDRQPHEGGKAYAAFLVYRDMGPARTFEAAARIVYPNAGGKRAASGRLREWATAWDWHGRTAAWDAYQDELQEQALERRLQEGAEELARRIEAHKEAMITLSEDLLEKVRQMLTFPVSRRVVEKERGADGKEREVAVILPSRWTFRDVATIAKAADSLKRLALGMTTKGDEAEEAPSREDEERQALHRIMADPDLAEAADRIAEAMARKG